LPDKRHRIIQFVSSYKEEGASEVALETAIIAPVFIGQRVLFYRYGNGAGQQEERKFPDRPNASLKPCCSRALLLMKLLRRRRVGTLFRDAVRTG